MKLQENISKKDILKRLKIKDYIYFAFSIIAIVISNIEIIKISILELKDNIFMIYNIALYLIIIVISIYGILNRRDAIINEINIEILKEKNKNLLEVNDHVRCFKHDFNNILQAIDGYIMLNDMGALKKYFNSLLKDCKHMNSIDNLSTQVSKNPAIYGILADKYKIAEEKNIDMNIDVLIGLDKFKENSYVISRVMGILLDNAIEATNGCEEKIVNIQFMKDKSKKKNLIIIENTYSNKNVDTNKIFEKNYTTKEGNSGLGLWKIRDILSKDMNLDLYTTKDYTMFKQQLEIYN